MEIDSTGAEGHLSTARVDWNDHEGILTGETGKLDILQEH